MKNSLAMTDWMPSLLQALGWIETSEFRTKISFLPQILEQFHWTGRLFDPLLPKEFQPTKMFNIYITFPTQMLHLLHLSKTSSVSHPWSWPLSFLPAAPPQPAPPRDPHTALAMRTAARRHRATRRRGPRFCSAVAGEKQTSTHRTPCGAGRARAAGQGEEVRAVPLQDIIPPRPMGEVMITIWSISGQISRT